jgi:hypothetical protein
MLSFIVSMLLFSLYMCKFYIFVFHFIPLINLDHMPTSQVFSTTLITRDQPPLYSFLGKVKIKLKYK